jgi:hypothetical protein
MVDETHQYHSHLAGRKMVAALKVQNGADNEKNLLCTVNLDSSIY